jgi:hypothetical protein
MAAYSTHAFVLQSQIAQTSGTNQKSNFGIRLEKAANAASLVAKPLRLRKTPPSRRRSHQWLGYSNNTMVELGMLLFVPMRTPS